ncbi:GNAT family N-acetyltransferase [Nocardioides sp.]|uniref:GNAT family N-acetyltransferase n=1 Tax=Nocardioides sp. TaxID=35761 RepID=UPI002ED3BE92
MELRLARPEELDELGELSVAAYEEFMLGAEDGYRLHVRDAARRAREAELWVAAEGDALLGCVTYCPPGSPWREISTAEEGEFRMLAVHPDARGRGAGLALAELCEDRARQHGATGMVLSSLADMAAAHRLYARLGYTRSPDRDWDPMPGVHLIAFDKVLA